MKNLALLVVLVTGCGVDEAEDGIDDPFVEMDGKSDGAGLTQAEAAGVLRVANELALDELRAAGVTSTAARNIVARRPYATLVQLDAVPYVGPVTLSKLVAAAHARGYVQVEVEDETSDRFTLPSCTPMTYPDVVARISPGQSSQPLASGYQLAARSRPCNTYTGCGAWSPTTLQLRQMVYGWGVPLHSLHRPATSGDATLIVRSWGTIDLAMVARAVSSTSITIEWLCSGAKPGQLANAFDCSASIYGNEYPSTGYLVDDPYESFITANERGGLNMSFKGVFCTDGRYAFVSKLAPEISPTAPVDGANNKTQIAIWGRL